MRRPVSATAICVDTIEYPQPLIDGVSATAYVGGIGYGGKPVSDKVRTARVEHRCTPSSWHPGCGRVITKGERYLSFSRGGLSTFSVCGDCAGTQHGA